MHQLMNQEIARLHRAETLREARRPRVVEQEQPEQAEVAEGFLIGRLRSFVRAALLHAPAARAS